MSDRIYVTIKAAWGRIWRFWWPVWVASFALGLVIGWKC